MENNCCGSCREVVLRAYQGFRASGGDDPNAFRVAVQVLKLRHPERSGEDCVAMVAEWLGDRSET